MTRSSGNRGDDDRPDGTWQMMAAFRQVSSALTEYAQDLGRMTQGYEQLERSLTYLTATVESLGQVLRGGNGQGVLMTLQLLKHELADLDKRLGKLEALPAARQQNRTAVAVAVIAAVASLVGTVVTVIMKGH